MSGPQELFDLLDDCRKNIDALKAGELAAAEHRVAEAALNLDFSVSLRNEEYILPFSEEMAEFTDALASLRQLKGEG